MSSQPASSHTQRWVIGWLRMERYVEEWVFQAQAISAAARRRQMDEAAEINIFERGPHLSFANCGLPHDATRLLRQNGFQAENLSGGYLTYLSLRKNKARS